jgi:hypothetical protein
MNRVILGDVFETTTSRGRAYLQVTHKHPKYGFLVRVLPGFFNSVPNIEELVGQEGRFVTFFPVAAAMKQGIVRRVATVPVPSHAHEFPLFRTGVVDPRTGKVAVWWLWDGEKEWRVDELTPDQRRLPLRGIWNDTLLIKRIESDWLPEKDLA